MGAENSLDLYCTEPGSLAGRYLRSFWQLVYRAKDLRAGEAVPLRIMSEDFTLYRGESGKAHVVAFRCAHRGTQLRRAGGRRLYPLFLSRLEITRRGSVSNSPARMRRSNRRSRFAAIRPKSIWAIFVFLGDGAAPHYLATRISRWWHRRRAAQRRLALQLLQPA